MTGLGFHRAQRGLQYTEILLALSDPSPDTSSGRVREYLSKALRDEPPSLVRNVRLLTGVTERNSVARCTFKVSPTHNPIPQSRANVPLSSSTGLGIPTV
jgi:hypothetical protein